MSGSPSRILVRGEQGARPLCFGAYNDNDSEPLLNSAATPWAGAPFELHETRPNSRPAPVRPLPGECHLRVVIDGHYELELRDHGREVHRRGVPGSVTFHCGTGPRPTRVVGSARTLVMRLDEVWLRRVLPDSTPPVGIHPVAEGDATARALAQAMCTEVATGAGSGTLFAESLSTALLAYSLGRVPFGAPQPRGGLSEHQCRKLRRHIDERLAEDLCLAEMAALCGLQPRHFTTVFRKAFGMTPYAYVIRRRLERGAHLLAHSGHDIAEIALRVGFSSQSHFTTAFRKAYHTTPRRYALDSRSSVLLQRAV